MQPAETAPLVIVRGMAGTAKTFYSLAVGLEKLLCEGQNEYRRILICRPNAQFDLDIGFLPGDEQEKISPLLRPVMDNLEQLIDSNDAERYRDEAALQDKIREIFARGIIQAEAMNFIRGRSIAQTYLIIDEAQNMTPAQVKGVITRAGKGTKIILLGDPGQIDRPYLDASFQLRKGEVLGIAGLDGSGRTEVLENLFGAMTREGGTITLHGKEIRNRNPREAIKNGFALLTEERRATGIFGIRDIRENTVISSLKDYLLGGICLSDKKMSEQTDWAIKAMHIKTPSQKTQIRSLSGGNQQKVIIGRWLLTKPEVLLLDEPTRGIDVGAKYEIYQLIIDLANEGKGVIMVSSEMPELLGVCDRIIVMSGGQVAGEVDAQNTSQEEILTLAAKYV